MNNDEGVLDLIADFRRRNAAALARVISIVENNGSGSNRIVTELKADVGSARRIGITGPPGVGKSTLSRRLIEQYRQREMTVAIVAVDPTSPVTGGAFLGDRIRMAELAMDPGVFVRSMATRGALGGLASTTHLVCDMLDAFGFDRIIIETVGIGQSDSAVTDAAHSTVLVLVPESGDGVQVLKAGIMEVADIFVVNKADRPGADQLAAELHGLLEIVAANADSTAASQRSMRNRSVLLTVAIENTGIAELIDAVEDIAAKS